MRKRYTNNTKRPKPKENQLGILKIAAFCQKIQQKTSGPGEHCWCYVSLLSGSKKGTVGVLQSHNCGQYQGYMLTLQALAYTEGND